VSPQIASAVHTLVPVDSCARGGEGGGLVDLVISSAGLSRYAARMFSSLT